MRLVLGSITVTSVLLVTSTTSAAGLVPYNANYARYYDSNNGNVDYRDFYYRFGSVRKPYNANFARNYFGFDGYINFNVFCNSRSSVIDELQCE